MTKIKDFTHVIKVEFGSVEAADKAVSEGLLLFHMHVAPDQISRDEFISLLTCFYCYKYEDHTTKNCVIQEIRCSECSEVGHKWTACQSDHKKCLHCGGDHRTLAMAWPWPARSKKKRLEKRKNEMSFKKEKSWRNPIMRSLKGRSRRPKRK